MPSVYHTVNICNLNFTDVAKFMNMIFSDHLTKFPKLLHVHFFTEWLFGQEVSKLIQCAFKFNIRLYIRLDILFGIPFEDMFIIITSCILYDNKYIHLLWFLYLYHCFKPFYI